ncbi:hypothetical protein [Actinomyces sp. zg328]|uniref:hypothetical protein n=1 Tax=Actinomyces sp. zg328 TaxID=2609287 RepID=UPI0013589571|nr:hypothetical protein [Actinomyces sp. zg328]
MDANETTTDSGRAEDDATQAPGVEASGALVEVLPGLMVAYGGIDLKALGAEVLDVDITAAPDLSDKVAGALAGANLVAQGAQATLSARGLVRLAPETLQALRAAHPVVADGWNLGTLVGKGGRFTQSVRWLPATSAQAATVLAGLGPALVLAAISAQASALASTADRIESKVDAILAKLERRDRSDLKALLRDARPIFEEICKSGFEHAETRSRIETFVGRGDLGKMYERYLDNACEHVEKSVRSGADLRKTSGRIASDVRALIAVWRACDIIGILSIGSLAKAGAEKEKLLLSRAEEINSAVDQRHGEVTAAVSSLRSRAHLLLIEEENPGRVGEAKKRVGGTAKKVAQRLPFLETDSAPTLRDAVGTIDKAIDSFDDARLAAPGELIPEIQDGGANAKSLCEALRWLLPADEELLALVEADQGAKHLVVTSQRWGHVTLRDLLAPQSDALKPLEDLRYVVDSKLKDSRRRVEIVTREGVTPVEFKGVEEGTDRASAVDRTLSLLRTAMNLPDDEREHDPLLCQPRPARVVLPSADA